LTVIDEVKGLPVTLAEAIKASCRSLMRARNVNVESDVCIVSFPYAVVDTDDRRAAGVPDRK